MEKNLRRNFHEKEKKMDRACVRGCVLFPTLCGSCPSGRILAGRAADRRGIGGCDGGVHRDGAIREKLPRPVISCQHYENYDKLFGGGKQQLRWRSDIFQKFCLSDRRVRDFPGRRWSHDNGGVPVRPDAVIRQWVWVCHCRTCREGLWRFYQDDEWESQGTGVQGYPFQQPPWAAGRGALDKRLWHCPDFKGSFEKWRIPHDRQYQTPYHSAYQQAYRWNLPD